MSQENFREFERLEKELLSSPGWKFEQRIITNLGTTYKIFQANRNDLIKILKWFEDGKDSFQLMDINNRGQLNDFFQEVTRLFHNFLASVYTLIEHTRNILKEFNKDGCVIPEYNDELIRYFENPESQFIQQSRHYMTHNACIFTGSKLYGDSLGYTMLSVTFCLNDLKKGDRWNAKSLSYINSQTENPRLLPLVEMYSKKVNEFYLWLVHRLKSIYDDEIKKSNEIKDRMKELWGKDISNLQIQ